MSTEQSGSGGTWQQVDDAGRVFTSVYGFPGGTSRTTAVRAGPNTWLVFSPGAGLEQTPPPGLTEASELVLVAPAVAHTLGLRPWREAFPDARLVASSRTAARLRSKLELEAESLDAVEDALGDGVSLHAYEGSGLGEVWLRYETETVLFLLVCDGFTNLEALSPNVFMRAAQWLYGLRRGLRVTPLYRYNITDRPAYRAWVEARLAGDKRVVLVPCHGQIDDGPDVAERVRRLVAERF